MTPAHDTPLRRERLRDELPAAIDMLRRRRCSEIPTGFIDDYVALRWFEWRGGGLRVTPAGEEVCSEVVHRPAVPATVP